MLVDHMEKMTDLMNIAAKKLYIRYPKFLTQHVFGGLEDAEQVGWVRMLESKKIQELVELETLKGNEGLIITIDYRGMIDYIRSVAGREGRGDKQSKKQQQILMTTYYMDYYQSKNGESRDLPIYSTQTNDVTMVEEILAKEVNEFMRKKLSRKDKMIMDYIYQCDLTQKEVGKEFKVSESRINQIKTQAIRTVRRAMEI